MLYEKMRSILARGSVWTSQGYMRDGRGSSETLFTAVGSLGLCVLIAKIRPKKILVFPHGTCLYLDIKMVKCENLKRNHMHLMKGNGNTGYLY